MKSNAAKQYTVRNVPRSVDRLLKKKAEQENKSLNAVLLEALSKEAGVEQERKIYHDLDFLIGTWVHDEEVDRALKEVREIDPKDWK